MRTAGAIHAYVITTTTTSRSCAYTCHGMHASQRIQKSPKPERARVNGGCDSERSTGGGAGGRKGERKAV